MSWELIRITKLKEILDGDIFVLGVPRDFTDKDFEKLVLFLESEEGLDQVKHLALRLVMNIEVSGDDEDKRYQLACGPVPGFTVFAQYFVSATRTRPSSRRFKWSFHGFRKVAGIIRKVIEDVSGNDVSF